MSSLPSLPQSSATTYTYNTMPDSLSAQTEVETKCHDWWGWFRWGWVSSICPSLHYCVAYITWLSCTWLSAGYSQWASTGRRMKGDSSLVRGFLSWLLLSSGVTWGWLHPLLQGTRIPPLRVFPICCTAFRVLLLNWKLDPISFLLKTFQELPLILRIKSKFLTVVYKAQGSECLLSLISTFPLPCLTHSHSGN